MVKLASDSYEGWFNLGVAHQRSGRLDQATLAYNEAARIRPGAADVQANLGASLHERGEIGEAVRAYQNALVVP